MLLKGFHRFNNIPLKQISDRFLVYQQRQEQHPTSRDLGQPELHGDIRIGVGQCETSAHERVALLLGSPVDSRLHFCEDRFSGILAK